MIWSPSTSSPRSSTAITRSPSPSSARPSAAPRSTTVRLQQLGMRRAAAVVDVAAVGRGVQHVHARAGRAQHARPDLEAGAVRAVEHDVETVEPRGRRASRAGARRTRRRSRRRPRTTARAGSYVVTRGGPRSSRARPRARPRSRPRRRRAACAPSAPITFTPLSVHGLWLAETIARGHARGRGDERDRRRRQHAERAPFDDLRLQPGGERRPRSAGPDARVSRPTTNRVGLQHPGDGATRARRRTGS